MHCRKVKFPKTLSLFREIAILELFHCGDRKVVFWKGNTYTIHRGGESRKAKSYPDSCVHFSPLQIILVCSEETKSWPGGCGGMVAHCCSISVRNVPSRCAAADRFLWSTGSEQLLHCCCLPSCWCLQLCHVRPSRAFSSQECV